jgi:hypothetical protein
MDQLLTEREAAKVLRISVQLLRKWRALGEGPEYIKLGKCVRYAEHSLARFLAQRASTGSAKHEEARNPVH